MRVLVIGLLALAVAGCAEGGSVPVSSLQVAPQTPAKTLDRSATAPADTAAPAASDGAEPEPTDAATPEPAPGKVVVKGKGSQKTTRFELADGDYAVVVTGKGPRSGNVIVDLVLASDKNEYEGLVNEIADKGAYSYETNLYGLAADSYYLDAVMPGGGWTVTFTPQ